MLSCNILPQYLLKTGGLAEQISLLQTCFYTSADASRSPSRPLCLLPLQGNTWIEGLVGVKVNWREAKGNKTYGSPWLIRLGEVLRHDGSLQQIQFLNVRFLRTKLLAVKAYTTKFIHVNYKQDSIQYSVGNYHHVENYSLSLSVPNCKLFCFAFSRYTSFIMHLDIHCI
jgi:hypothetical protein